MYNEWGIDCDSNSTVWPRIFRPQVIGNLQLDILVHHKTMRLRHLETVDAIAYKLLQAVPMRFGILL